jgi:hypothetical protein
LEELCGYTINVRGLASWEGHDDFLDFFMGNGLNENLIHVLGDLGGNSFPTLHLRLLPRIGFLVHFIELGVKVLQEKSDLILVHHLKRAFLEFRDEGLLVYPLVEINFFFEHVSPNINERVEDACEIVLKSF